MSNLLIQRAGGGSSAKAGRTINGAGGRFVSSSGMTDQQAHFVKLYLSNGANATEAAKGAGYSNYVVDGWRIRQSPAVRAAIRQGLETEIQTKGANTAWGVMEELMTDKACSPQVRFSAAKFTLEASGIGLQAAIAAAKLLETGEDKPLSEMSMSEIESFVARSETALGALRSVSAPIVEAESVSVEVEPG